MANVKAATVRRIAVRDYGPWIGLILSVGVLVAMVGDGDAVRLIAAWAFVRSARLLTGLKMLPALRKRLAPHGNLPRETARAAITWAGLGLIAGFALSLLLAALLYMAGEHKVALLCAILTFSLPPRYLLPLGMKRRVLFTFRAVTSWSGLFLLIGAWMLDGSLWAAAIAFALREWIGLAVALIAAPPIRIRRKPAEPLAWPEIAASTALQSRRRLSYRLGKGVLTMLLGPVGAISARVGRSARVHHRLERFVPRNPLPLFALSLASAVAAGILVATLPTPATLAVAGSFTMVASVATNVLILGRVTDKADEDADEDEDEA